MPSDSTPSPEPSAVLTRALLEAYRLPATPATAAYQATRKAFDAYLRGSTCIDTDDNALSGIPPSFVTIDPKERATVPLIRRGNKLYLSKLDHLEQSLADTIQSRLRKPDRNLQPGAHWLPQPKPGSPFTCADQQKAVQLAVQTELLVLTGGPGTGKTTTAACIIGATLEAHGLRLEDIRLCAPTGRAASQLHGGLGSPDKALAQHLPLLGCADLAELQRRLPKSYTIHKFVHNAEMMAGAKLVIVDECSMIDLSLFLNLLKIIPDDARLVLIGDPQQLPSVDTGSVFADLCRSRQIEAVHIAMLKEPFRAQGEAKTWFDFVVGYQDQERTPPPAVGIHQPDLDSILAECLPEFGKVVELAKQPCYATTGSPLEPHQSEAIAKAIKSVRILCAYHGGKLGVRKLNEIIRKRLGLVDESSAGSLVMVTRNDHKVTDLSNGDVGLVGGGDLVWFPEKELPIPFTQLPPNTPAFATTIHKSQGSEYGKVLLVLPPQEQDKTDAHTEPFITKQLVFTGVTRAQQTIAIFSTADIVCSALNLTADRATGLKERLDRNNEPK